jgi:hypothetical protein
MTTISRVATAKSAAAQSHTLTAADLKTAKHLRTAINGLLARVRLGPSLPAGKLPKLDAKTGLNKAPNGDLLVPVQLSKPRPSGAEDMPTSYALVDPKKNQFYAMTGGGLTGATFGRGPLALPGNAQFKGRSYNAAEVKQLTEAALPAAAKPREQHYEASVSAASWNFGSGVALPGGKPFRPGINATITLPYIDVKPEWKVKTDEKTHTITVTIDGISPNKVHPEIATRPQDISIPADRPKDLGAEYKLVFKDHKGKQLFATKFTNMLPA